MEIKGFYKELYSKLKEILKPYGFRKKGDRFRSLLDNGIAWEIEIQRNEFKIAKMYSFTVNIYIGLISNPKPIDIWSIDISQLSGNLGEKIDGQWDHQKWYDLSVMVNPQVKAQIKDGKRPLTYQEPGKEWQTKWIPVQNFEEIIDEVCELAEHKVIPLYLSVQTLDGYIDLLETNKGFMVSKSVKSAGLYADTFGRRFLLMLNKWIEEANSHLEYLIAKDMSKYDEFYLQSHEHSIATAKERIVALSEIEKQLQEKIGM